MKQRPRLWLRVVLRTCLALSLSSAGFAWAAPHGPYNRPSDQWRVLETRHFRLYYSQDTPKTARFLAGIADDTFERLNAFYGYEPSEKIGVSIVGYTSFSNGFAESQKNRITIYTTPANFQLRSRAPWLENVFTHELSHILSLNAAASWSPRVPMLLGTGVGRVQSGEGLARVPIWTQNLPHWFMEGVAQFDTERLGRDSFDENRKAFARAALEDDLLFPLGKLAYFGDEQWYNSGFSFLRYVEQRFGEGSVHRLFEGAGEHYDLAFESLFSRILGVSLSSLERDFRGETLRTLQVHLSSVHGGRHDGRPLALEGQTLPYRQLTPEQRDYLKDDYASRPLRVLGGRIFYRKGELIHHARFEAETTRLVDDRTLGRGSAIAPHVGDSFFVLRQEGHEAGLAPSIERPDFESPSLFVVTAGGKERRLLRESRLLDLDVCEKRRELAGVYNDGDGSVKLALYTLDGFGSEQVRLHGATPRFPLPHADFDEVRSPRYSPDCSKLYFSRRVGKDHDIFYWDFTDQSLHTFADEPAFELYPEPTAQGVYFVSARDGSMSAYFKANGADTVVRVSEAVTAHHYPVRVPEGLLVGRLTATGLHSYFLPEASFARAGSVRLEHKPAPPPPVGPNLPPGPLPERSYSAFSPRNLVDPSFVPLLDFVYDKPSAGSGGLAAQAGIEIYLEDQLRTHALWLRGFLGSQTSAMVDYRNDMSPLTLDARVGYTRSRSAYTYARSDGESFEHVLDYSWGFLYGSAAARLNLFYTLGLEAETIRDIGTTSDAQTLPFDFLEPRYGRDRLGAYLSYSGLDRSDPTFRERFVNRRGYREIDLRGSYAVEEVHPALAAFDASLHTGRRPYARSELDYREYIALPKLMRGFFDHTLELQLKLGWISRDIRFLPFFGGGHLYSQTTSELNTSVGFAGYSGFSVSGETLASLGATYRFPLLRSLSLDWGPFFLEDVYGQFFTTWGNIWGFDPDGRWQRPFLDRAPNGRHVIGDVGFDLRLLSFFQEVESNMGTTLRVAYRAVPFSACPAGSATAAGCRDVNVSPGFRFYFLLGAGF